MTIPPDLPSWTAYVAVGTAGGGLLLLLLALVPPARPRLSPADRIEKYVGAHAAGRTHTAETGDPDHLLGSARQAAEERASRFLSRNADLETRITASLEAAGSPLKAPEWLLVHLASVVGAGVLGLLLGGGNVVVGLLFIALGAVGPWLWLSLKRRKRQKRFNAALPDTLQLIAGSLSAGLSLAQAVDTVVREGQEPICSEFRRVLAENRLGVGLEDALDAVAERTGSTDFTWAVMAIRIQREVGGNLAALLESVAGTMREREYLRRQVGALSAEGKLSAIVLGALPPLFLVFLLLTRREYVAPLYTDPRGIVMLVGGALWLGVGIFWMSKLVKVEV